MTREGTVKNGVVVLAEPHALAEGTRVEVIVVSQPTLRGLLKFAGTASNLPPDMAEQHDHYIHGTPRRTQANG